MIPTKVIMKDKIIDRNSKNHILSNAKPFPSYFTSQVQGHTVSLDQLIPVKEKRGVENCWIVIFAMDIKKLTE